MKLEHIQTGMIIKNYKEMCRLVGEEEKTGYSKQKQIKEWERHVQFKKEGQKLIIDIIYTEPIPIKKNPNIEYLNSVKKLILGMLVDNKHNGIVCYSKFVLLNILQMTNDNYSTGKNNTLKVAQLLEVDHDNVNEFFELSSDTLTRHLEQALDSLSKNKLITWYPVKWVSEVITQVNTNENGSAKVQRHTFIDEYDNEQVTYESLNRTIVKKRMATKIEVDNIREVEREIMVSMGFTDWQSLIRFGKWHDYKRRVSQTLLDKYNIEFYYDKYEIRFHPEHVEWEVNRLEKEERDRELKNTNNGVLNRLSDNTVKRVQKAKNKSDKDPFMGFGANPNDTPRQLRDGYLETHRTMIDKFIDIGSDDIRGDIIYTKLNSK